MPTATIAANASLSGAIDLNPSSLLAIAMPSAWTSASLTFQSSYDGSTYFDVYNDAGDEYIIPVVASQFIILQRKDFLGLGYLKVRSGTTGTPVNQTSARTIGLIIK